MVSSPPRALLIMSPRAISAVALELIHCHSNSIWSCPSMYLLIPCPPPHQRLHTRSLALFLFYCSIISHHVIFHMENSCHSLNCPPPPPPPPMIQGSINTNEPTWSWQPSHGTKTSNHRDISLQPSTTLPIHINTASGTTNKKPFCQTMKKVMLWPHLPVFCYCIPMW